MLGAPSVPGGLMAARPKVDDRTKTGSSLNPHAGRQLYLNTRGTLYGLEAK